MTKYSIYAGMGGSFGGAVFQLFEEFNSLEEAQECAYQLALEQYQSYEGLHGILSWEDCRQDLLDSYPDMKIDDEDVDAHYQEELESWIEYYVLPFELTPPEDLE